MKPPNIIGVLPPLTEVLDIVVQDMLNLHQKANTIRPETSSVSRLVLFSSDVGRVATTRDIQRVASEFGKFMPESEADENVRRVEALVNDDPVASKREEIQLFVYQLSNNLIDDPEDEFIYYEGKHTKIMTIFESIGLTRAAWKATLAQILEQPTGRAFVENLFEAAVSTSSLDTCEILLEAGAHPDQLIEGWGDGEVRRPIQYAAGCRRDSAAFVRLLIRFGARVDAVTEDNLETALHKAARYCDVDTVRILVEAGADLTTTDSESHISHVTALAKAAAALWRRAYSYQEQVEIDEHRERRERKHLATLEYLLPLYDTESDHDFIQTALIIAMERNHKDMLPLFLDAGATVNGTCPSGYTPLLAAVTESYKGNGVPVASALLELGADPNISFHWGGSVGPRPIHIAAIKGDARMVQLLIHAGADLNACARFGKLEIAELLGQNYNFQSAEPGDVVWDLLRCRTPLEFSFYRDTAPGVQYNEKDGASALALVQAGASLNGHEFARAPAVGSVEVLDALLGQGADVNEVDWRGRTALQNCLTSGNPGLVKFLLGAGAELRGGELLEAVRAGDLDAIRILLKHGATNKGGKSTPSLLAAAAESRNWDLFRWLIESHGEGYDESALCMAVCSGIGDDKDGDEEALMALLDKRPPRAPGRILEASALAYAAFHGQRRVVDRLVEFDITGICIAPLEGDEGYHTLGNAGVWDLELAYKRYSWRKPTGIRFSVLALAIAGRKWDIIDKLLAARFLPDRWPLLVALGVARRPRFSNDRTHEDIEKHIVKSRTLVLRLTKQMVFDDINERAHPFFDTPLQAAARFDRADIVRHLLSLGVDVNAAPGEGIKSEGELLDPILPRTALQAAVENGNLEVIDLLLDAGADVNGPPGEDSGATALQLAAGNGHIGIARKLIGLGADVNGPEASSHGRTAVEAAAGRGRLDMVQFLLESGAQTSELERKDGLPPFYWAIKFAKRRAHAAIVKLLRDWKRGDEEWEGGVVDRYETTDESDDVGSDESDEADSSEWEGGSGTDLEKASGGDLEEDE